MSAFQSKVLRGVLPSAARTVTTTTQQFTDTNASALRLYLNVSAASGSGGLLPIIRGYDKYGNSIELTTGGVNPVTQTGTYAYEMTYFPSDPIGNIREAVSRAVPYTWDVIVKHQDSSSYTYSLSVDVVM